MRPQLTDNLLKYGVLQCRDLVELYYGWRMVASIIESSPPFSVNNSQVFTADPRRIKYEIVIAEATGNALASVVLGSQASLDAGTGEYISVQAGGSYLLTRNFRTDFDSVTQEIWGFIATGSVSLSVRETFLTPPPVDEIP